MNTKTKQVLAVMTLKVMYAKRFMYWDTKDALVRFTDIGGEEGTFHTLNYFAPSNDNGDVLFDVIQQVTGFKDSDILRDVFYFTELILEDIYETKVKPFFGAKLKANSEHFLQENLTKEFLEFLEEERQVIHALINGGYYDEFTTA